MQRRSFLMALAATTLQPSPVRAAPDARLVSMDYAVSETLLSIGVVPLAQVNVPGWATWVVEPALPAGVTDLGAGLQPNLELMAALKPDRILTTPYLDHLRPAFERIAPTTSFSLYDDQPGSAFDKARALVTRLGALFGRERQAAAYLAEADATIDACAARIAALPKKPLPILLFTFIDPRHAWVFGRASIFQAGLERLGLDNAWREDGNAWGFSALSVERLVSDRPARFAVLAPVPADVLPTLARSPLWRALPAVRGGEMSILPVVHRFGGFASVVRLARVLADDLERAAGAA